MKKLLLSVIASMMVVFAFAQYPTVTIQQINASSATDLQACVDTSAYFGDTVRVIGTVVIDGNLSEVSSGSITGGSRPFISLVDTTNNGAAGSFKGLIVMGVNVNPGNTPNSDIENALAGDVLDITGVVGEFNGALQLQPLDNNSVSIIAFNNPPTYATVPVADLQNSTGQNLLPTGEQWDGSYVEIQNVTVTSVSTFSGGSRTEFTVQDANGNRILIADRFFPMRMAGQTTVNPNSPDTVGSFVPPVVGQVYTYIRGLIFQDENGCAGGGAFAGGYEMNPFDTNDVQKAAAVPPQISLVRRTPTVPNGTQSPTVSADIVDTDGTVATATLYYSSDRSAARNTFSSATMTNTASVYSASIPSFPNDSIIRYYIEATDNGGNISYFPGPNSEEFYTVRPNGMIIPDLQFTLPGTSTSSPYEADTVTVKGIVTSSFQPNDMGYLYIQDANAMTYAGIFVEGGGTSAFGLNRGDEVTVTGTVQEQFGFTKIVASTITATGNTGTIMPTVLNPSDSNFFTSANRTNLEPYESMLLSYKNPQSGGKVNIINPNLGFGEYTVGSGAGATVDARVLAGRQQGTQAQSSLNVSVLSDTGTYAAGINVAAVQADISQNMDELVGILYYSFSNFKLTPRNNADFIGFNQPLVSIAPIFRNEVETAIYPNPTEDQVNIRISNEYQFDVLTIQVLDMTGRTVIDVQSRLNLSSIDLDELDRGLYMIRILNNNEVVNASKLILK